MNKYLDKNSIVFGIGIVVGGAVFTMLVADKLPSSLGGNA